MIRSIPNPQMTTREVTEFRAHFHKCVSGNFTQEEKRKMAIERKRIKKVAEQIIANSGGKNPILGY